MQLGEALAKIEQLEKQVAALLVRLEISERRAEQYRGENERLRLRVADLEMRVRSDSDTSHKPPSSDPPWKTRHASKERTGHKPGARRGHRGVRRKLLPIEQVDELVVHRPTHCQGCSHVLSKQLSAHLLVERMQLTELPEIQAKVIEHRSYEVTCPLCQTRNAESLPKHLKGASFGPRLQALVAYLAGSKRMSWRSIQTLMQDVFGLAISQGTIGQCEKRMQKALNPVRLHAEQSLQAGRLLGMDETSWRMAGKPGWLWTMGHERLSVFRITESRSAKHAKAMLGEFQGLLSSDRYGGYRFYNVRKRQLCWAHIHREVRAIQEHDPTGKRLATRLDKHIRAMFAQHRRIRDGTMPHDQVDWVMLPIEARIERDLHQATRSRSKRLRTLAKELLKLHAALWTYRRIPGAEPTNNLAERNLRHAVLWRKSSLGTQSETGNRFVECMLSVQASLTAQHRNIFHFLHRSIEAYLWGKTQPLLTP